MEGKQMVQYEYYCSACDHWWFEENLEHELPEEHCESFCSKCGNVTDWDVAG